MKILILLTVIALFGVKAIGNTTRKDGTHIEQHYRSNPNETTLDNWSVKGNTNPYTGQKGYKKSY